LNCRPWGHEPHGADQLITSIVSNSNELWTHQSPALQFKQNSIKTVPKQYQKPYKRNRKTPPKQETKPKTPPTTTHHYKGVGPQHKQMVAGGRFELPTFGL
jgi:hypothetical protein